MKGICYLVLAYLCGQTTAVVIDATPTITKLPPWFSPPPITDYDKVCQQCTECLDAAEKDKDIAAVIVCEDKFCDTCEKGR